MSVAPKNLQAVGQMQRTGVAVPSSVFAGRKPAEKRKMNRSVMNLIAAAERSKRCYAGVPPGSVNDQIESELAAYGYAVALSDRLWIGGYRVRISACRTRQEDSRHL